MHAMTALKLYVSPASSPCRAVLLTHKLLDEQPPLEVVSIDLGSGEHRTPEFLALNPLHTVPTLEYVGKGSLWESRAIMKFLCSLAGPSNLYPASAWSRAQVDRLLAWDQGSFYPSIGRFVYPQIFDKEDPDPEAGDDVADALAFLDRSALGSDSDFLVGEFATLADISIICGLMMLELVAFELEDLPRLVAWKDRMKEIPGFREIHTPFQAWKAQIHAHPLASDGDSEDKAPEDHRDDPVVE